MIIAVRETPPTRWRIFYPHPKKELPNSYYKNREYSMLKNYFCAAMLLASCLSLTAPVVGQSSETAVKVAGTAKPFKILTTGKKITIQSKQNISSVIVWTAGGHRVIEQKEINALTYSFNITVQEKIFFVRVDMGDGRMYSQKVGVQ